MSDTGPENPLGERTSSGWAPPQAPGGPEVPGAGTPPASEPVAPAAAAPGPVYAYAGWWQRVGASLVDLLILLVPILVLVVVVAASLDDPDELSDDSSTASVLVNIASALIPYLYYGFTMSRKGAHNGQTWGKQAVGIRVHREDGREIGFWWAVLREFVKGVLALVTLLINYLWPLWDRRNQALHDKLMRDVVTRD